MTVDRAEARAVRYRHVELPDDLPITADAAELLDDHPIRYLHRHQCAEIGICLAGNGVFVVGEKVMEFSAGDVTFINPSEVHLARSMPGTISRWDWIYLDPVRMAMVSRFEHALLDPAPLSGPAFHNVIHPQESPHLESIARRMVHELTHREAGYATSLVALTAEMMVMLRRVRPVSVDSVDGHRNPSQFERIAPAVALIARSFADNLTVASLARACNMSEPTLRRAFAEAMGCSPREYWIDVRLQMAASMLRSTSLGIAEVSDAVGFATLSNFNRLFVQRFGSPPRRWRQAAY